MEKELKKKMGAVGAISLTLAPIVVIVALKKDIYPKDHIVEVGQAIMITQGSPSALTTASGGTLPGYSL